MSQLTRSPNLNETVLLALVTQAGITTPPLPHQMQGIEFLLRREGGLLRHQAQPPLGGLLADVMGLGKTYQIVALAMIGRMLDATTQPTLVVVPKTLLLQWRDEILLHTNLSPDQVLMYHSHIDRRTFRVSQANQYVFVLTTYETVANEYAFPVKTLLNRKRRKPARTSLGNLFLVDWSRVILDEAHIIRNAAAYKSVACAALPGKNRWALTGTAFNNSTADLASLCAFLKIEPQDERRWWKQSEPTTMHQWRQQFMLRRNKSILQLPPLQKTTVCVPSNYLEEVRYQDLVQQMLVEYQAFGEARGVERQELFQSILVWILRLRQTCNDPWLALPQEQRSKWENQRSEKTKACLQLIDHSLTTQPHRKIIVYSQWTQYLDRLQTALVEEGVTHLRLDGRVAAIEQRSEIIQSFTQGSVSVLLASLHAGGLGLNLTAASMVVFCDPWFNPQVHAQAHDRVHRLGQTQVVDVYYLASGFSIEAQIEKLQATKKTAADFFVDGIGDQEDKHITTGSGLSMVEMKRMVEGMLAVRPITALAPVLKQREPIPIRVDKAVIVCRPLSDAKPAQMALVRKRKQMSVLLDNE